MSGFDQDLHRCPRCGYNKVGSPAGLELPLPRPWHVRNRHELRQYVASLGEEAVEWLLALFLTDQFELISVHTVGVGDNASCPVNIPQIICRGLAEHATMLVLVHNHPSKEARPSASDMQVTRRLASAAQQMGLRLLDHFIVAGDEIVPVGDDGSWEPPSPSTR